jgi:hypothetical protein
MTDTETTNLPVESAHDGTISAERSVARMAKDSTNLAELAHAMAAPVVDLTEYGDGLEIIGKDGISEDTLLGVPFVIFDARFHPGSYGDSFLSLSIATLDAKGDITGRFVLNDGSTGIRQQWARIAGELPEGALFFVKRGLRKSEFLYSESAGRVVTAEDGFKDAIPACTYYLNI